MIVNGKNISRCYRECPYFDLEGGPGPIMICLHPTLKGRGIEEAAIIEHPDCDTGFPVKCPEQRLHAETGGGM